jgi:xylulokinase
LERSGIAPRDVLAMVYTTQMLGLVPMGADGQPMRPAIIWLDGRAPEQAERLMRKFLGRRIFALVAGAELSGKDGMPKLLWLKENEPQIYHGMACFLDVNGYLTYRATDQMVFEWSGASAFGLDLKKKDWLRGIIRYMGLDLEKFPPLVRSVDQVGGLTAEAARDCGLLEGTPIFGGGGDVPGAAVGSGAVGEGEGPDRALLLAEMETAGACLKWIADEFYRHEQADPNIPNVYALMDQDVDTIPPGSDFLVCTPWMYGERSPVADTWVRSTFFNLSADHSREHLLRAVYEGVAYNLRWMIEIVETHFGFPLPALRVVGGGAQGAPWMQIIADVTGRRVETVVNPQEAGAVGAALTAAVGLGLYPDFAALKNVVRVEREFEPQAHNAEVYDCLYQAYQRIYGCLRDLYREVNEVRFGDSSQPLRRKEQGQP